MRYRPLGNTGMAVSAVSLTLSDSNARRASDWVQIIYAGLENGINAFYVVGQQSALIDGFSEAMKAIDRNLVFVGWRLGWTVTNSGAVARDFSAEGLTHSVESAVARTGLGYVDAAILDDPKSDELSPKALEALKQLKEAGRIRLLGVSGQSEATDAYISSRAFDLLATTFNIASGWKERLRLKAAIDQDMAVIGYGYQPEQLPDRAQGSKPSAWGRNAANPLAGAGTYAFLDETPKWTAEEICLAYAMTEPSLCTVQIAAERVEQVETLAKVPERELPPNVPAQIEMARFSPPAKVEVARRA
jgi:aryl-alcohol dehydrogenase-like predicted oxidoreductase